MKHCEDKCSGWYNYHDHYFGDRDPLGFCLVNSGGMPSNQEISKYVNGIVTNCPWCGARLIEDKKEEKKPDKTQEYYQLHYEMWDWLAENPGEKKGKWFELRDIDDPWMYECFLCAAHQHDCLDCPLKIAGGRCDLEEGAWHNEWTYAINVESKIQYARKIRDVVLPYMDKPVKKESALETHIKNFTIKNDSDYAYIAALREVNKRLKAAEG